MPIFFLEPRDDATGDPRWEATTLKEGCWVLADTEADARDDVSRITLSVTTVGPGMPSLQAPWLDKRLVDCQQTDPGLDMRKGIIVTRGGKTLSLSSQ